MRALDSIRHFLHGGYNKLPVFVLHLLHKDIGAVSGIYRAIFKLIKLFRGLRVQILAVNEEDYLLMFGLAARICAVLKEVSVFPRRLYARHRHCGWSMSLA